MDLSVLMIVRGNIYSSPGGDTTQIVMTAKYLRELGVSVDIQQVNEVGSLEKYDLLHFFNIIRPDDILPFIKSTTKPVYISTIFVDYAEYEKKNREGIGGGIFRVLTPGQIEYIKAVARWLKNGDKIKSKYYLFRGHKASVAKAAKQASVLLPNSHSEGSRLFKYLGAEFPYRKVVNAIEPSTFNDTSAPNEKYRDHVLCIGRIEGRKNQLNLIKALADTDLKLTIIGKPSPNHIGYYQECKELAKIAGNVEFIEHISHAELVGIYKAAKVHVLPSWFETTGLSTVEAGVMDCNIVITNKGDTEEYFADMAYYCQPDDVKSIKEATLRAFNDSVNEKLKGYILNNYTWQKAAEQTLDAYKLGVNKSI